MDKPRNTNDDIEKKIQDLEDIFNAFKVEMQALKFEQEKIVQEYITKLSEKKKETLLQNTVK